MNANRRWADAAIYVEIVGLQVRDNSESCNKLYADLLSDIEDQYRGYGRCNADELRWLKRAIRFAMTANNVRKTLGEHGVFRPKTGRGLPVRYVRLPGGAYELYLDEYGRSTPVVVSEERLTRFIVAASLRNVSLPPKTG